MNAYGISTGAKINSKPFDWAWELDECKSVTPGGLVRIDYHGSGQDWLVQEILNRGLAPLLLIQGTMPSTQTPAGHATIVKNAVTKWKGKVAIVEVGGNEPNVNGQTPQQHIALVKAGFQAARSVDPSIDVINGGLAPSPTGTPKDPHTWATQLLPGLKGYITHFNMHLYEDPAKHGEWNNWSRCFDLYAGDIPSKGKQPIRAILDAAGMKNVPICSTESGGPVPRYQEAGVATIVKNAVAELAHRAAAGEMSFLLVFSMRDNDYAAGYGLCRLDHSPRPAYAELKKGNYQVKIPIAATPQPPPPPPPPVENISQDIHDAWAYLLGTTITGKQFAAKPSTRGKWQEAKKLLSDASVAAGGNPLP
jgi:hypothetical protein